MPNNSSRSLTIADLYDLPTSDLIVHPHPLIVGTDRVGIEVELENLRGVNPYENTLLHWNVLQDGSLRNNGIEFVTLNDGIGGDILYNATQELDLFLSGHSPDPNWRCSTHVHLDVRDCTEEELKRIILAYIFFERFLFRESGWHRYKNNFCVPIGVAQSQIDVLSHAFSYNTFEQMVDSMYGNWNKYTALNLRRIRNLGTLEFRMPQPTFKSSGLIKIANRFLSLKKVSKSFTGDLPSFLNYLVSLDIQDVFEKCTGRNSIFIPEDIDFGFTLAMDLLTIRALKEKSNRLLMNDF